MRRLRRLAAAIAADPWDALAALGVALLAVGLGSAWAPLYLIVPGIACLRLGLYGARAHAATKTRDVREEESA